MTTSNLRPTKQVEKEAIRAPVEPRRVGNNIVDAPRGVKDNDKPYSAFEHWWRTIAPRADKKERYMALLSAYFDESYGTEDAYSVAGYIATIAQWEEFEGEWCEMLKEFGVSYMRKADLEHLEGDFKQWKELPKSESDALKIAVNQRAISIIRRNVSAGFSVSVKKSEWESADKRRWLPVFGSGVLCAGSQGVYVVGCGLGTKTPKEINRLSL